VAEDADGDHDGKAAPRKTSDAWIFVSHSHKDLNAVRRVRDEFERLHANPLLFFLMCLKEDEEVGSLIEREITARNFFLLCDSPAARNSPWVQKEREIVRSLKERKIHELDLDWPWEQQKRVIHETLQSATTFLNYASSDRGRILPYIDLLVANDFAVFEPSGMSSGESWVDELDAAITRSVTGYFFTFLSQDWLRSVWARKEIERFLALTANLATGRRPFLVALDPIPSLSLALPAQLRDTQILDFSGGNIVENCQRLLEAVELRRRAESR
jgi:TIR domain